MFFYKLNDGYIYFSIFKYRFIVRSILSINIPQRVKIYYKSIKTVVSEALIEIGCSAMDILEPKNIINKEFVIPAVR